MNDLKIRLMSLVLALLEFANVGVVSHAMMPSDFETAVTESENAGKEKLFNSIIEDFKNKIEDFRKLPPEIRTEFFDYVIEQGCDLEKLLSDMGVGREYMSTGLLDLFVKEMIPIMEPRIAGTIFGRIFKGKNAFVDAIIFCDIEALQDGIAMCRDFNYDIDTVFRCRLIEYAALVGNVPACKFLLMNGAEITEQTRKYALMGGNIEIIRMLEQYGEKYSLEMRDTFVLASIVSANREDLFDWWQYNFGEIDKEDIIISCSIAQSVPFAIRHLKDASKEVLDRGLTIALMRENLEMVELLIKMGADINVAGKFGETALTSAANYFDKKMIRFLIDNGADVNIPDWRGHTALVYAAARGKMEEMKLLIESGADINAVDNLKRTVIMRLISYNAPEESIKLLIEKGADVNAVDLQGETALSIAIKKGNEEIVQFLKMNGAK